MTTIIIENFQQRLVIITFLILSLISCGTKNKSDRDFRREQIRNNVGIKRDELQNIVGIYEGIITTTEGKNQNVILRLDIKDIPSNNDYNVDPILIPTLSGFIKFHYGENNSETDNNNYSNAIGFEIKNSEYDAKRKVLNLTVLNSKYEEIFIDLKNQDDILSGIWTAPGLSLTGKINLINQKSKKDPQHILPDNKIKGVYKGYFKWLSLKSYQPAQLTISTKFLPPDNLNISATIRLFFGGANSTEYITYHYNNVDLNPFNGTLTMRDPSSKILIEGEISEAKFTGRWFSDYTGDMGEIELQKNMVPEPPANITSLSALSGSYFGRLENLPGKTNLPANMLLSFVATEDAHHPDGLIISGQLRLYPGGLGSVEYIELPIDHTEFDFFTRKFVAKATGRYPLTLIGELAGDSIIGHFQYDALGKVANFTVKRDVPPAGSLEENIQGEYRGILKWKENHWLQRSTLKIITNFDNQTGLKISATATLAFGPSTPTPTEYLTYNFPHVDYNLTTGQFIFKNEESEISFVATIANGIIEGVWKDKYLGEMGSINFTKLNTFPTISEQESPPALQGTYWGRLENTNAQTNLPNKIFLGIVTGRDINNPESVKISANLRFYLGSFDSLEYQELPLENIRFNFYTREFIANTHGKYYFTIKGIMGAQGFSGNLFHDGPGEIALIHLIKKDKS